MYKCEHMTDKTVKLMPRVDEYRIRSQKYNEKKIEN